jgi:hypothetical protein
VFTGVLAADEDMMGEMADDDDDDTDIPLTPEATPEA